MNRILVGITTVASLLSMNAFAADLSPRTYTKAPMMVDPGYNWSGFYVGGNIGYSWGRSRKTETLSDLATGTALFTNASRNGVNGVIGGGQVGYNWQASNWLFGLEADVQGSGEKGSSTIVCVACGDGPSNITSTLTQKLDWFGTVRGRAGVLVTPAVLLYATGGLAYGGWPQAAAFRTYLAGSSGHGRFPGHLVHAGGLDGGGRRRGPDQRKLDCKA